MEPHSNQPQGLHLPQPVGTSSNMSYNHGASVQPLPQAQPIPMAAPSQAVSTSDQTDDLDKEWIAKAKMIVEQTKHDPYLQSQEFGKIKADYLRIRFNKHVKVGPEKAV